MTHLPLLRRWAEQHHFDALRDACLAGLGVAQDGAQQVLLALAQAHLGDADAARATLAALGPQAADTLDLDARVDLAAVHLALQDLPAASALLEAALHERQAGAAGDYALLLARLGWCRMQQGRADDALALYQRSAAAAPRVPVCLNLLRLQLQAGDPAAAQQTLDQLHTTWAAQQADEPPDRQAQMAQQLRGLQLDIWLASDRHAEAEAWLADQRTQLDTEDWCALLTGCAQRLAAMDRHAQGESLLRDGLQHLPAHIGLIGALAELAQVQGRPQQAAALWRRAIRHAEAQAQDTLVLWTCLSGACLQHDEAGARRAAERALALAAAETGAEPTSASAAQPPAPPPMTPSRAQAELSMAAVEAQALAYAQAEARYRAVLATFDDAPQALSGLGGLLMQLGRMAEAVALFERLCYIDPAKGHAALISARQFPDDEDTLVQIEAVARTPGPEGRVRSGLLLQLAAAWEKRRDFARAFALADEANAASRQHLRYDPVAHRQRCARVRHAFSRDLYQHCGGGSPSTLPVFVLGMPRSGTTLVEQIIAGHSQIHGAGELGLIPEVIAGLERWERHAGSGRHYPDCVDDLSPKVLAGVANKLLQELQADAPQARHVVDKLPHNFENIGLIKLLFPNARIISVRRDPRDIAISNYFTDYAAKHGGMGFAYDLTWIGEQLADHNLLMHHWQQVFPGQILEVRYEDVVADTEAAARRMLAYIGVDWEPGVLRFNELDRPVKTASVWQVRQPIYTSSKARWERYADHLAPLLRGTNAKIGWQPITDMVTLPVPGLLEDGVALFNGGSLDDAERCFRQLLQHVPEHAAANFMLGLVELRKGWLHDGIARMEQAQARCPWNQLWRDDLARAHRLAGEPDKALALAPVATTAACDDAGVPASGADAW